MRNTIAVGEVKKAIVVGATSGIGREIAKRLLAEGYTIGVAGRRTEELERLRALDYDRVFTSAIDVNVDDSINKLHQLIADMGGMNLFVLTSGVGFQSLVLEPEYELKTTATNALGFVRMIDTAYRYFSDNNGGHIAAISSIAGTRGIGVAPAYSATKRFQRTYLDALAQLAHMEKAKIHFTEIRPGFVKTDLLDGTKKYPMLMTPQKVADKIVRAINRRQRVITIDWRYRILVAVWRMIPQCLWERMRITN